MTGLSLSILREKFGPICKAALAYQMREIVR